MGMGLWQIGSLGTVQGDNRVECSEPEMARGWGLCFLVVWALIPVRDA